MDIRGTTFWNNFEEYCKKCEKEELEEAFDILYNRLEKVKDKIKEIKRLTNDNELYSIDEIEKILDGEYDE